MTPITTSTIILLATTAIAMESTLAIPANGYPYSWNLNAQLWQRLCVNPYISNNVPGCGIVTHPYPPSPPIAQPPSQQLGSSSATSSTNQCINGECFATTCNNGICSSTGNPPSPTPGQYSTTRTVTCVNGVCTSCVNGVCSTSNNEAIPPVTNTQR